MTTCSSCGSVAPPAARFCPTCAAPLDVPDDGAERKLATLVFADLVGSTAFAGSRDPERTRVVLERFYDAMAEEIATAGGTVEKFAGDAVMAAFGAPIALEDHAERALHAAIAMRRRLHDVAEGALELRIGVNTGEVAVGRPREGSSFVTGDAVNVAARLEQSARPGEILVGERTVSLVRGAFEFDDAMSIEAKGKPEGVPCRRLRRALSLMRPRGVQGLHPSFVGREEELAALLGIFDDAVSAGPRLVTILGDAGVGKTRLVREFWEVLGGRTPDPMRRTGRCLSYGEAVTYWPLAEVLREHFGFDDRERPETILTALGRHEILGTTLGLDVAPGLHPLAARDRLQDGWVSFVEELCADRPLVMLIEDVHWADDLLLDLLERLILDARGPFLLVTTGRQELLESRPGWGTRLPGTTLVLEALAPDEAERMLDGLLGGALPSELRELVVRRAEGNPFFVEEVLGTLIDQGLLTRDGDGWVLATLPGDFSVPDTVQAVAAARMDLLGQDEKLALQAASVIGRTFWAGPVYELAAGGRPDLRVLEARDFVRRRGSSSIPGEREYAIKHALTREVAYASLPKARRARMHAAFARWLERAGLAREEFAPLLAHHYAEAIRADDADLAWADRTDELATLRGRALVWLREAAALATSRMEVDDALAMLHRAIALEDDPESLAALWHEVGRVSILKYDGEGFWTAMQASLATTADPSRETEVYADLAFQTALRSGMWRTRPDDALISGWIDETLVRAPRGSPARAKALVARVFVDPEGSEALAREALSIAESLGSVELRSFALDALGGVAMARGDYETAADLVRRRLALLPELSDPDHVAMGYGYGVDALVYSGSLEEARTVIGEIGRATRRLSPHHRLHAAFDAVRIEALEGRWGSVRELTPATEAAVAANADTPCALENLALLLCALAFAHAGEDAEARRLEEVVAGLKKEGFLLRRAIDVELAILRRDHERIAEILEGWTPPLDDVEGVIARLDGLVVLGRRNEVERDAPGWVIAGSYLEPFSLRALGWARRDRGLVERAVERFEALGLGWHAAQTRGPMFAT